ncbi:hypothetical protein RA210_U370006 [Rubrivivax sp. A210]|nr:hypothetical protein RA210_U370006 [Rubrivivax sp. A210]
MAIGSATVSEDGSSITSDLGAGVIKAGWHCGGNPNTTGSAGTCPTCKKCQGASCVADNAQTPPQASPTDCKEQICSGGAVSTRAKDSETPTNECRKCSGGTAVADAAKNGVKITAGCCFDGEPQPVNPIADLAKCPARTEHPGWVPGSNGCGGSGISSAVPDNPMFALHITDPVYLLVHGTTSGDFTQACNGHDTCYDKCLKPAGRAKSSCDTNFGSDMDAVCLRDYSGLLDGPYLLQCLGLSAGYEGVVSSIESFYESAQKNACDCCGS